MLTSAELDRLCVVLVGSRNPLNIGSAARAMSNFGFLRLRVVHPYDVAFREARSAVDAEPVLTAAEEFDRVADAVSDCALVVGTTGGGQRKPDEPLQRLDLASDVLREQLRSGNRVAVLFGSEKVGLSNQDMSYCQLLLRIPTRTEHLSMNLGQAVAVVLYELVRDAPGTADLPPTDAAPATCGERERLISLLVEAVMTGGPAHGGTEQEAEEKVRRLVRHLPLRQTDVHAWLGLVRQMLWKMGNAQGG